MNHESELFPTEARPQELTLNRRQLLVASGTVGAAVVSVPLVRRLCRPPQPVFLARHARYDGPLAATIRDGLAAVGFDAAWVRGRRVLLKPNLVEPTREIPHMTTHPAVVAAAAEVFRAWGAEVIVGEAPGHMRDTETALVESGVQDLLDQEKLPFVDCNYSEVSAAPNRGRTSSLAQFFLPPDVIEADLIVSLPKLKTHHWVGMTAAMKNLYGLLPGVIYGWPKNILHAVGIPETVVDLCLSLPRTITIVDGIVAMEGDGPVMGTPKPMGLLAVGQNLAAVDATLARIMGLVPERVPYLLLAHGRIGLLDAADIAQRGERWEDLASPFAILDFPHLQAMRISRQGTLS